MWLRWRATRHTQQATPLFPHFSCLGRVHKNCRHCLLKQALNLNLQMESLERVSTVLAERIKLWVNFFLPSINLQKLSAATDIRYQMHQRRETNHVWERIQNSTGQGRTNTSLPTYSYARIASVAFKSFLEYSVASMMHTRAWPFRSFSSASTKARLQCFSRF